MAKEQQLNFSAPEPPAVTAEEGAAWGKELALRYLPQTTTIAAGVAFGRHGASPYVRLQAARLLANIAGIGQPEPMSEDDLQPQPQPISDDGPQRQGAGGSQGGEGGDVG